MKECYLVTCQQVFESTEKTVFLNRDKANKYFKYCIESAFKYNETDRDDDGNTLTECECNCECNCDPYTVTLEIVNFDDGEGC